MIRTISGERLARALAEAMAEPDAIVLCLLTAAMLVLGGGGSVSPGSELTCELIAALAFGAWLIVGRGAGGGRGGAIPRCVLVALALLLVLPVLQLLPLPPAIWSRLPGRAVEYAALALVGRDGAWMPLSVSPARTLASLLSLAPPAIALVMASGLRAQGRRLVMATVALCGVASVLLGALQLADGYGRTWRFYPDNPGYLNGFQANRNAEVDVLLVALLASVAVAATLRRELGERMALVIAGNCVVVLSLGAVLTGSRAGIALMPLVGMLALLTWLDVRSRLMLGGAALVGAMAALAPAIAAQVQSLQLVAARFSGGPDFRAELWRDTWTAIVAYWPVGSGVGTFKPVFIAAERLTMVDPTHPVRAHNDYLEFVLEGGAAALAILAVAIIGLARLLVQAMRHATRADRPTAVFCLGTLLVIALHSVVDYPLRSMALAHLGVVAVGLAIAVRASSARGFEGDGRGSERA